MAGQGRAKFLELVKGLKEMTLPTAPSNDSSATPKLTTPAAKAPPPEESYTLPHRGRGNITFGRGARGLLLFPEDTRKTSPEILQPVGDVSQPLQMGAGRAKLVQKLLMDLSPREPLKDYTPLSPKRSSSSTGSPGSPDSPQPVYVHGSISNDALDEPHEAPLVEGRGKAGKDFTTYTNYIRLFTDPKMGIFQYDIKFNPSLDSRNVRMKVMKLVSGTIGDTKLFDGTILYLPKMLPQKVTKTSVLLPREGTPVEVTITFTKHLTMGHPHSVHLYNVLFRRIMSMLGLAEHGRNFFDPNGVQLIPEHKLEIWPGFVTSIQNFEGGVMLCCDASCRVLHSQTVYEVMDVCCTSAGADKWQQRFSEMVIGSRVLTRYNNKVYKVDDIIFDRTPNHTFTTKGGGQLSYVDYYKQQYDLDIKYLDQPLLRSVVKKRIRGQEESHLVDLVPELCYTTGITEQMRLDFRVMKSIANITQAGPQQRVTALTKFLNTIQGNKEAKNLLDKWGLQLSQGSEPLTARTLNCEEIHFGNNNTTSATENVDWTRAAGSSQVLDAADFSGWHIVCTTRDEKLVREFVAMVHQVSKKLGIRVDEPNILACRDEQQFIPVLKNVDRSRISIAVIMMPLARADRYSAVKKYCCHEMAVPSQCIVMRTLRNPDRLRAVTIKIVLQMNCKLGGSLWTLKMPLKSTMICGIDVYHHECRPSVGAIVASMNQPLTRWYSKIYKSGRGIELQDGLESSFIHCLRVYNQTNGALPETIVLYRDGVGDGEVPMVVQHEVPQLMDACHRLYPGYDPKLLVVIVQKRVATRYYGLNKKGEFINPAPGSILDHTVTRRDMLDFFLVSASSRIGTVTPTHYIVAHNSTSMDVDKIQRLTFKTTHLYYNWTGTVRVPAPCQYAHKLAYLVGENIDREADETLVDKLYYL